MIKKVFLLVLVIFSFTRMNATHNRAGEITYVQLSEFTFEITITTFTYSLSFADRPTLDVAWGDNTTSTASRLSILALPNYYKRNIYKIKHTYPGPGIYRIVVQDPNRNQGVKNIPNSVNVIFSISTILTVNPSIGLNSTPVLLNPPYDKAAYGYVFVHNPAAFDPDGDSLSYKLTVCTREDGKPINNYTLPPATRSIRVDSISGDLIWDTPADTGIFNVAMEIQEWRYGKKIGIVVRDMQIDVFNTKNKPPVNNPLTNYCVEAGDTVDFIFSATDPNNDFISLKATSGVFQIAPCLATFTKIDSIKGFASSRFRWVPCHEAVRNQPYNVILKSDDNNAEVKLSDIDNMNIKVIGPSPVLNTGIPEGKQIRILWTNYGTNAISGFSIYRKEGPSEFKPDSCTAGIPLSTGFVKVGYAGGSTATSFVDNDNGQGLQLGKEYAYRIVAVYPNGTESKTSNEITSILVSGLPVIKNVSVQKTDAVNGVIFIAWKKPDKLDTIPANGPYEYQIFRATGTGGSDYTLIKSIKSANLNDSTLYDTLNTKTTGYIYKIELWNDAPGNRFLIGEPGYASSLFLEASPGDRKTRFVIKRNVPWINSRYDFFRFNETTSAYDSIGSTNQLTYIDSGLENGKQYCYFIRSVGAYQAENLPKNLINLSEIVCSTPVDNEPPCPLTINVTSQCDSLYNTVKWSVEELSCLADIAGYKVFYKPITGEENFTLIASINDKNIFSYNHYPGESISGCYYVTSFDFNNNESENSLIVCVDSCNFYEIPNVFTPNGDNINDRLVAKTSALVERVEFSLFNRNGLLLFRTDNPRIEWDGTYNDKIVSPGIYFYQCEVYENRASGIEQFHLSGFVHLITERDSELKRLETK